MSVNSIVDAVVGRQVPADVGALYAEQHAAIVRSLLGWTGSIEDAHDLAQETFLRAWQYRERIDPDRPVAGWLWTIARNLASRHRHRRGLIGFEPIQEAAPYTLPIDHETPERLAIRDEERMVVHRVLPSLPEQYVEALVLRYGHDLMPAGIALRLGVNLHTVKQRLLRARAAFRRGAEALGETPPAPCRAVDDDAADRLLVVLRALTRPGDRLPGRAAVCRSAGLSEHEYHRLMARLVARGSVVDRSHRRAGRLAS